MRRLGSIFGLMIATCVLGCELGRPPIAPKIRQAAEPPIDSRALLRCALTCMMAPILHDAWQRADDSSSAFDAEATSCFAAARASRWVSRPRAGRPWVLPPWAAFQARIRASK